MIEDVWRTHQLVGMVVASFAIPALFAAHKRISIDLALLWGWLLFSAARVFTNPDCSLPTVLCGTQVQTRIDTSTAYAFGALLAVPLITLLTKKWRGEMWLVITALMSVNCLLVHKYGYGMFNAHSADTAMIASLVPLHLFAVTKMRKQVKHIWISTAYLCLAVTTIFSVQGATGVLVLAGGIAAFAWAYGQRKAIGISAIVVGLGVLHQGSGMWRTWDRTQAWESFMSWWWTHANHALGTGVGSFEWLGPYIGSSIREVFVWFHNDWLKILFESGVIGFTLTLLVSARLLWFRRRAPSSFGILIALGLTMLAQFPVSFFLGQLMICMALDDADGRPR